MNYILDTNVISELIAKQPDPRVVAWVDSLAADTVFLTVITIGELRRGIAKLPPSKRQDALSEWLANDVLLRFQGKILAISTEVMLTWGELTGRLEREGRPMPVVDALIAAIALHGRYTLATHNEDDFAHSGVMVVNPWRV